jgi:hypothetical protein
LTTPGASPIFFPFNAVAEDEKMNPTFIVALVAAGASITAAFIAYWAGDHTKKLEARLAAQRAEADRRAETEQLARKFREPLAHAAYDLQSRIFNIVKIGFLELYLKNGNSRTHVYAVKNTVFLIAQYFAWTELVRREIRYIDSGTDEETKRLARLRDNLYSIWQTDKYDPLLRIFAGEQRAIGERLICEGPRGPGCKGYAAFLDFYQKHPDPLLAALESDITTMSSSLGRAVPRLVALQHGLIDLLAFLDPDGVRFPEQTRTKLGIGQTAKGGS